MCVLAKSNRHKRQRTDCGCHNKERFHVHANLICLGSSITNIAPHYTYIIILSFGCVVTRGLLLCVWIAHSRFPGRSKHQAPHTHTHIICFMSHTQTIAKHSASFAFVDLCCCDSGRNVRHPHKHKQIGTPKDVLFRDCATSDCRGFLVAFSDMFLLRS